VSFKDQLQAVVARVPEAEVVMIVAKDGIPVETVITRPQAELDDVAALYANLLRSGVSAADAAGHGQLQDLTVVGERSTALLHAITKDYALFAVLANGAIIGRARYALRLAGIALRPEFQ
jgi:predicted regulator of Ras-like GTPase activity (Roadblock/LC7/MglB family)